MLDVPDRGISLFKSVRLMYKSVYDNNVESPPVIINTIFFWYCMGMEILKVWTRNGSGPHVNTGEYLST